MVAEHGIELKPRPKPTGTVEQIPDDPVLEKGEQLVEVPKTVLQDRIQQRTVEQIVDARVPEAVEELAEVSKVFSQDRIQERTVEQTIPAIPLAEKIIELPVIQTEEKMQRGVNTHVQHVVNAVEVEKSEIIEGTVQRKKPIIQEKINQVTKRVEIPELQFTDKVVDNPVVAQRQISMETVQKSMEIPQLQITDKVIDVPVVSVVQVSDAVPDACFTCDATCKVACETCVKDNMFTVTGEITVAGKTNHETIVRGVVPNIGFESLIDDSSSVDSKGLNYQDCEVLFRVNKQSINIADSVHVDKDDLDDDAHLRHARDETENAEFLTGSMATRLHVPVVTRRTAAAAQHRSTQQQHNHHRKQQQQQAGQTEEEKEEGERRKGERGKEDSGDQKQEAEKDGPGIRQSGWR